MYVSFVALKDISESFHAFLIEAIIAYQPYMEAGNYPGGCEVKKRNGKWILGKSEGTFWQGDLRNALLLLQSLSQLSISWLAVVYGTKMKSREIINPTEEKQ
jgi:hypothetical protein